MQSMYDVESSMMDVVMLLCFFGGFSLAAVFFWPWNRALRRDADHWYRQFRSRDEAIARIAEANATTSGPEAP